MLDLIVDLVARSPHPLAIFMACVGGLAGAIFGGLPGLVLGSVLGFATGLFIEECIDRMRLTTMQFAALHALGYATALLHLVWYVFGRS